MSEEEELTERSSSPRRKPLKKSRPATAVAIDRVRAEADASVMRRVSKAAADYQVSSARAVQTGRHSTSGHKTRSVLKIRLNGYPFSVIGASY